MTTQAKSLHVGPNEGEAFSAVGDVYRVLASADETACVYSLSEIRVSPGNGPPPHVHSCEDEAFFVVEGEVTFQIGKKAIMAKPGTFIQGPTWHSAQFQEYSAIRCSNPGIRDAVGI